MTKGIKDDVEPREDPWKKMYGDSLLSKLKEELDKVDSRVVAPATEDAEDFNPCWIKERAVIPVSIGTKRSSLTEFLAQGINAFRLGVSRAVDILISKNGVIKAVWMQSNVPVPSVNSYVRVMMSTKFAIVMEYFRLETDEEARLRWLNSVNPDISYGPPPMKATGTDR